MPKPTATDALESLQIVQKFAVSFEYPVHFTSGCLEPDSDVLVRSVSALEPTRRHRVWAALDEGLLAAWPSLRDDLERYAAAHSGQLELRGTFVIAGGEAAKQDPLLVDRMLADLRRVGMDRHSFVLAFGGGAVLDAVGYAAAIYHRGIRLVRIPTTVLGQNDAGIGVKNGINAFSSKNFLGTFAPPFAVINDSAFLSTLSPRDQCAGMAEAVKVALIRDAAFFGFMQQNAAALAAFEPRAVSHLVRRAAEIHLQHIALGGDPFERGNARPLDYGHWSAHKLELLSAHALKHGEAVAIGMALDARYSAQLGWLSASDLESVCTLLEQLGFTLWHDALRALDGSGGSALIAGLHEFREHMGGELNIPFLAGIGETREAHSIDEAQVALAIDWLAQRSATR